MSERTHREDGRTVDWLDRLAESSQLAHVVPLLPSEALRDLVQHNGIESCSEILAAATPAQLADVADLDMWSHMQAGQDEQFDTTRFGSWVEGLVDSDATIAATIVARLDIQLVTAGLSRYVRVFDPAAVAFVASEDPWTTEGDEVAPPGEAVSEIGGYVVRARVSHTWDAIVTLLVALEAHHSVFFHSLMRGCRSLSCSRPERDGFHRLPDAPEQWLDDMAVAREQRLTQRGYPSPAAARAFLCAARRCARDASAIAAMRAIAGGYVNRLDHHADQTANGLSQPGNTVDASRSDEAPDIVQAVAELVNAVGSRDRPRALLGTASAESHLARLHTMMASLRLRDEGAFLMRERELAFLANALVAGCSFQARPFSVQEATEAAMATCNLGLELWPGRKGAAAITGRWPATLSESRPFEDDLLAAFHLGWAALHETSVSIAERLIALLTDVRRLDSDVQRGLFALRRDLLKCCQAGEPWGARDALDVLATLDMIGWTAMLGALDECPVLAHALRAIVEGQRGAVSATRFEFVSSVAQLAIMRSFGERLAGVFAA